MKYLQWKIDGEFICNIARTWFWDENRPYEKSEELLLSALGTDEITLNEKKRIAQDIIEGRKKLIGINVCELVDDNENIRPISQKINELNRTILINNIKIDMELYPLRYVDPYSTIKSIKAAEEYKYISSYNEAYEYFCFGELDYDKENDYTAIHPDTKCGLWLFDYPEFVADFYGKKAPIERSDDAEEFWKSIYEAVKDWDNEFKERNKRYLTSIVLKEEREKPKQSYFDYDEHRKQLNFTKELINKNPNEMSVEEYINYTVQKEIGNLDYNIRPDNCERFEGLISPKGDFYSCNFGGHNVKAYYLMVTYFKDFGFQNREEAYFTLQIDKALDNLIEAGWMATRYLPSCGAYLEYKNDIHFRATKEQKDTIWKAIVKHDVKVDDVSIIL